MLSAFHAESLPSLPIPRAVWAPGFPFYRLETRSVGLVSSLGDCQCKGLELKHHVLQHFAIRLSPVGVSPLQQELLFSLPAVMGGGLAWPLKTGACELSKVMGPP